MDNRQWSSGASGTPPTPPASPSVGYPTPGDPSLGIESTKGGAYWFHQIGEEIRAVLAGAGLTPSSANLGQLYQAIQLLIDAQSGNYALDTGVANAYVVALSPAITAYTNGMTVRFKFTNTNTGASTLNAGGGVLPLVNDVGGALVAGDALAGGMATATYDSTLNKFLINSMVPSQTVSQTTGTFTATLTGCTTAPTYTVSWIKIGRLVTLTMPDGYISATSNATTKTLTGVPAGLIPQVSQSVIVGASDNGSAYQVGLAIMAAATGLINLYPNASGAAWTAAGALNVRAFSMTYMVP